MHAAIASSLKHHELAKLPILRVEKMVLVVRTFNILIAPESVPVTA